MKRLITLFIVLLIEGSAHATYIINPITGKLDAVGSGSATADPLTLNHYIAQNDYTDGSIAYAIKTTDFNGVGSLGFYHKPFFGSVSLMAQITETGPGTLHFYANNGSTEYMQMRNGGAGGDVYIVQPLSVTGTSNFLGQMTAVGITGSGAWSTSGNILTSAVIGSSAGTYVFAGTTVTFAAPTIDTNDRIPILNNGAITFKLAVTDGGRTTQFNSWTGSNTYTAASTITVLGMLLDNSLTSGTSAYALTSRGPGLPPQWEPVSGSGYPNPGNADLNVATFNVTNVGLLKWANTGGGANAWQTGPYFYARVGNPDQSFVAANSTVTPNGFTFWAPANSTITGHVQLQMNSSSSNNGGFRFHMTGPANPVVFELRGGGAAGSATAFNKASVTTAFSVDTAISLCTFTSGVCEETFDYGFVTGATAGTVTFNVQPQGVLSGNNFIEHESWMDAHLQ